MGSSPSADLYYGYDLGEMYDSDYESTAPDWWQEAEGNDEGFDWEDELARRLGWVEVPFPDDYPEEDRRIWRLHAAEHEAAVNAHREAMKEYERASDAYRQYRASRKKRADLLAEVPVKLDTYGYSEGDTVWALQLKASVQTADDWGSIKLKPVVAAPEWNDQLARFIELLEFNVPEGGPAWHLNCSYG